METTHCLEITKLCLKTPGSTPSPSFLRKASRDWGYHYGLEVQEPQHLYLARAWDAVSPVHCLPQEALARGAGAEYSVHVHLSCEAYAALSAPLTEIVVWTLREGASRARVEELLAALVAVVSAIPFSKGMFGAGWGPVVDDERTFVVLIGWSSMEAFQLALQNSSDGKVLLMELDKFTERQLRHVVLRQSQERPLYEARL